MHIVPYVYAAVDPSLVDKTFSPIFTMIIDPLLELAFAVATVVFIFGVTQVIRNDVGSDAHEKGKMSMIWGVVGLFVMLSAWGLINLVANTVGEFAK